MALTTENSGALIGRQDTTAKRVLLKRDIVAGKAGEVVVLSGVDLKHALGMKNAVLYEEPEKKTGKEPKKESKKKDKE